MRSGIFYKEHWMKPQRTDSQNERIARAIILSTTNSIQRGSVGCLEGIERAIVKALDMKDLHTKGASVSK